jgi:protein-S-isoprenylcysteine O-methyltransferase Ste14
VLVPLFIGCAAGFAVLVEASRPEAEADWPRVESPARGARSNRGGTDVVRCVGDSGVQFPVPFKPGFPVVLSLLGALTCLAGVVGFRRAKTTVNPMHPDSTSSLVVSGIYGYTRNPMYLGFLLILLAWAAALSNVLTLLSLPAFVLYMNYFQILPEERVLASRFPRDYTEYRARVRRWL